MLQLYQFVERKGKKATRAKGQRERGESKSKGIARCKEYGN